MAIAAPVAGARQGGAWGFAKGLGVGALVELCNTVQAHMKVNPTLAQGTLVTLATLTPKINFLHWIFGPKPV